MRAIVWNPLTAIEPPEIDGAPRRQVLRLRPELVDGPEHHALPFSLARCSRKSTSSFSAATSTVAMLTVPWPRYVSIAAVRSFCAHFRTPQTLARRALSLARSSSSGVGNRSSAVGSAGIVLGTDMLAPGGRSPYIRSTAPWTLDSERPPAELWA